MGKFKDRTGHSRWQEGKEDISRFLDANRDKLPIVTAVIKMAVPRVGNVIDAITEVKASKMAPAAKEKTLSHLETLLEDLDGDGVPDIVQNMPGDFALKKYITPFMMVFAAINYGALQIIDLIGTRDIPDERIATAEYWLMGILGMWQAGRIINTRESIKKVGQ